MSENKKQPKCGFAVRKTYEGQSNFDKYFIDREIVQTVIKTGEGENDFVIKNKVIETKRDIVQVIQADACNAGIDAFLSLYDKTGISLPAVQVQGVTDYSQCGDNLADALDISKKATKQYQKIDPLLKAGRSLEEFINGITDEEVKKYCMAKAGLNIEKKPVEKKGDDK